MSASGWDFRGDLKRYLMTPDLHAWQPPTIGKLSHSIVFDPKERIRQFECTHLVDS